jgi:hypothetical protein
MNLQNSTKGVVSSEKENSEKVGTKQTENSKKAGQTIAAGESRANAQSGQYSL